MNANVKGVLWMLGAVISFSLMAIAGRALAAELDTFEIMLFRSLLGFAIICVILSATGSWQQITTKDLPLQIGRNIAHFTGQNLWFFAITLLPLAQVFALEFTTPIWVILLAPLFLGERLSRAAMFCAALGFLGILMIARPGVIPLGWGFGAAALSAVAFAVTMLFTKRLIKTHSTMAILFYITATQSVFGFICAGIDMNIALPSLTLLPYVVIVGICGLTAHFSITTALTLASPTLVAPVDFLRLPLISVVGFLLYNEGVDTWLILGAALILTGNYINILTQMRSKS